MWPASSCLSEIGRVSYSRPYFQFTHNSLVFYPLKATIGYEKWFLWHGNAFIALQQLRWLSMDAECYVPGETLHPKRYRKLERALSEFSTYIENNAPFIPNYGERYRYGECILTAFAESAVNEIVSRRMVKKQQMRWTQRGAHLLLQVRTRALDGDLRDTFCQWYPG